MPKLISEKTFHTIELMLKTGGRSYTEIAAAVGVEQSLVCTIARGKHSYQCDSAKRGSLPNYLPTPEQIETECARLRAVRKTSEVDDPEVDDPEGWTPPVVSPGTLD